MTLTLSAEVRATLPVDGAAAPLKVLRPGQLLRAQFTAPDTKSLGFAATANSIPQSSDITLTDAAGKKLSDPGWFNASAPGAVYLTGLTPGATYGLLVKPGSAAVGALTLWLSTPVKAGTLTTASPSATGEIKRPGQQLQYTVNAAAGDGAAVAVSGSTLAASSNIALLAPDGTLDKTASYLVGAVGEVDLRAPLPAGAHLVLIRPDAPTTGKATGKLVKDVAGGALSVGGAKRAASITAAGQNARYTVTGVKGQKLTLQMDAPRFYWELSVAGPDGKWLVDERYLGDTAVSTDLPELPADGTYIITVDPSSQATGPFKLGAKVTGSAARPEAGSAEPAKPAADTGLSPAAAGVVPSGPDAWQPGKSNLAGRDWLTRRGDGPKGPARLRAPPGKAALTGHLLKLNGKPLPGVRVTVGKKTSRTDARGRFLLTGISAQATTLVVDGRTANTKKRQYGVFHLRIHPKARASVALGFPVWMTPLDTRHTVTFDAPAKKNIVLKTPKIPGLEVRIPKGSVVRDERGRPVRELGITAIPIDRPPFPLPKNSVVPVYFTVQPGGAYVFPKGAQIVYPNYTHEAPGTRVQFMDYDPKGKGWHVYGHGQVSKDGRQVVPDRKTRVWAFHGAMFNLDELLPWDHSRLDDVLDWLSGDPVDLGTGMLTDAHTDLAVADPLGTGEVTRSYWQADTRSRAFGKGRDLSVNAFLRSKEQYKEVDLYLPGGRSVHYVRTSAGTGYSDAVFEPAGTPSGFHGTKLVWNGNAGWDLKFRDGSVWLFPQYAPLKEIRDRHGNAVRLTRADGNKGDITTITTPGGRWISLAYDAQHRVTAARDNTGRTTAYTYDGAGRLETVTDPAGKTASYTYDGTSNRLATAKDARGITYLTNTFDTKGRVAEQTLTEGAKYTFAYTENSAGTITAADVTQPGGAVRRATFGADGYGLSDTAAYGSDLARKTTYERGPNHRVSAVVDPFGRRTELHYDAQGNVEATTELAGTTKARRSGTVTYSGPFDQPTKSTDALGNATTLSYDAGGDVERVTDAEGRASTFTYAADGQVKTATDPAGAITEYTYRHGELESVKDPQGRTSSQFTDAAGRPSALTDEAGAVSTLAYDPLNQTRRTTDPLGVSISLDYDDNGNLTTLTDARENATTWAYDRADRPKTATDPLGAAAAFAYDAAGRATKVTSRSGQVATADWDLLGRAKSAQYGVNQIGQAQSEATYTYDKADLLEKITDTQAGSQSFSYDEYDRPRSTTGPTGTVGYDHDAADRRREMTAAGVTSVYGYDKSSILTSVKSGTNTVTFGLDAAGREKTATLPGGFTRTTGYDKTGTIKAIDYTHAGAPVGDLNYTRDERGLQSGLSGKLANIALPAAESGAAFGKDNRLTSLGGRSFTYDQDGQLQSDGLRDYTWNARGQLTGLAKAGGTAASFGYDPLGTRSAKTANGATRKFLTDGSNPLAEQNGAGETQATVATSGLDEFLTRSEGGKTQVYLTDALGSVVGLADADGTIATSYAYDPNGTPTSSGAATSNPYTFTGREDDGTGLLYYRNRYYDPQTGRFISQDPIGYAGGPNLYQYALSSPTTYTDPSGNSPMLAGCVVGGLVDGGMDWLGQRLSGRKVDWGQVGMSAAIGCLGGMLGRFGPKTGPKPGGAMCRARPNSFTADTPVLMADGTRKPIRDVRIGDKVLASDPETGESGPREVTALIKGNGDKQLVDLTLGAEGPTGTEASTLTATEGHPFWVPELGRWISAGELSPGQWLRTSSGTWAQISAVRHHAQRSEVYNLTVDDLHTYHVFAGDESVLVHNCGGGTGSRRPSDLPDIFDPEIGGYRRPLTRVDEDEVRLGRADVGEEATRRQTALAGAPGYSGKIVKPVTHSLDAPPGMIEGPMAALIVVARGAQLVRRWWRGYAR
ncbi:RHS repeat-associated core domain-containing protein [Streptomyces sp. H27-D2]|uniref:RHS repeat-associated core domain-containing protein n=1 Tax=Streptomyces sp. H27-D2 TaxID=3046304 RepID=UPI002DBF2586|nr:RHS repeat-associated core domain-containing protein [Streptomyces sp. H27-D2]MEC4020976.1 RHS repeat-associated core domain-containing protein [Streptomyces sp. H27-D2]